jgi:hypothetical protein
VRTRRRSRPGTDTVLIVAGADHLGRDSLEELARQAHRADTRLVLLLQRLRGDTHELLGGSDSAAMLMRLGNAREAATAAEFIGRGHRFVLSQMTEQVGRTFTAGTTTSHGGQESFSDSESGGVGMGVSMGSIGDIPMPMVSGSANRTDTFTTSRARTWQDTVSSSTADSITSGTTLDRVYEFTVEPTAIQALPATAFVLVEPAPGGRRVVMADCNPGISLLDRVAADPRLP